jgi:hypothetical protein
MSKDDNNNIEKIPTWCELDFQKDIELGDIIGGGGVGVTIYI